MEIDILPTTEGPHCLGRREDNRRTEKGRSAEIKIISNDEAKEDARTELILSNNPSV
jgi:hypothetical protein